MEHAVNKNQFKKHTHTHADTHTHTHTHIYICFLVFKVQPQKMFYLPIC